MHAPFPANAWSIELLHSQIDLTALFVEVVIPAYILNVEKAQKRLYDSSMNGPTPDVPIQDLFSLYRRTKFLIGMYTSFVPRFVTIKNASVTH